MAATFLPPNSPRISLPLCDWTVVLGKKVTSGQFNFDPVELAYMADHWTHLDHDQNWTSSAGISCRIGKAGITLDGIYGTGYRAGFANLEHTAPIEATVKIRYNHPGAAATISPAGQGRAKVKLHEPQRAITPGQAAVFYQDDLVVGGGWICR